MRRAVRQGDPSDVIMFNYAILEEDAVPLILACEVTLRGIGVTKD